MRKTDQKNGQAQGIAPTFFILLFLIVLPSTAFAFTSDKDMTLDDNTGDSPQMILRDAGNFDLTIQKMDAGEANVINTEGRINLKSNNDLDDYLYLETTLDVSGVFWEGVGVFTNDPAIRINASGLLEYRDNDESGWTTLDSLGGLSSIIQDTSPQLGGNLDVNGFNLTSAAGLDIAIGASAGNDFTIDTSKLVVEGDTGRVGIGMAAPGSALDVKGTLRLSGATSGFVGFAPAAAAGTVTYTLPAADGTSGQMLSTNGAGALSWASAGGGGNLPRADRYPLYLYRRFLVVYFRCGCYTRQYPAFLG